MISASIRFQGPNFFNIVVQPYAEVGKHFSKAVFPPEGASLLGRVGHVGAGLFLMIPIINNVVMAIILIGFKPRLHSNLITLLEQLKAECPDTQDPQVLIDYFCPRSLFPVQPQIQNLGTLEPVKDGDTVQVGETYLLMQLCEALYYCVGDGAAGTQRELCNAFISLGAGWRLGRLGNGQLPTWEHRVGPISIMFDSDFIRAVQAAAEE